LATSGVKFFLETIPTYNKSIGLLVNEAVTSEHMLFVERVVHSFKGLRAARLTAHHGYPMQGMVLLRNTFDDCLLTSGVMKGLTTFEELAGVKPEETPTLASASRNRRKTEQRVRSKMDGPTSGLSPETLSWLKQINDTFDWETHGGRLSTAHNMPWLSGSSPLAIVPLLNEHEMALFMNRYCEVAWMVHRLLPLLQLPGWLLPTSWKSKWRALDQCFNHLQKSLADDLKKPAFEAVRSLILAKFDYNENSYFPVG
jgi:hypothetical protein